MHNFIIPFNIFLPWFRSEKYLKYKTLTELTNAWIKGKIKKEK